MARLKVSAAQRGPRRVSLLSNVPATGCPDVGSRYGAALLRGRHDVGGAGGDGRALIRSYRPPGNVQYAAA